MTMITPSYLGETIEYSSLHACRSTLEDPTSMNLPWERNGEGAGASNRLRLQERLIVGAYCFELWGCINWQSFQWGG